MFTGAVDICIMESRVQLHLHTSLMTKCPQHFVVGIWAMGIPRGLTFGQLVLGPSTWL